MEPHDVDFDLLEKILDHLVHGHDIPRVGQPSHEIIKQVQLERDIAIQKLIAKHARSTFWANAPSDLRKRLEICVDCRDHLCEHITTKIGADACEHGEGWQLNGMCGRCALDGLETLDHLPDLIKLWDSKDLAGFMSWIQENSLQTGEFN